MKKILLILGILFTQTLYAADYIESYPLTYSIISQEDLTVGVVSVDKNYNETTLTIPAQIQYNDQTYTVIAIEDLRIQKSKTLEIPATVEEYSIYNHYDSSLEYISVDESNPVFASVCGILYNKNLDTLIQCPPKKEGEVKIHEGVTMIGDRAFMNCELIKTIVLLNCVKKIGDQTFYGCENLKNIFLSSSLEEIGHSSFHSCSSLETITIPNSVNKIGYFAFWGCSELKSIKLSDSLEVLELATFESCISLESIDIPSSVKILESSVFEYCLNLECIYIPAKVEKLDGAFCNCPKLSNIIIDEENPYLCAENGIIFNKGKTILVSYPTAAEAVEVQDGIKEIGGAAFMDCRALTKITLPASIEIIGPSAFYDCYDLKTLILYAMEPPYLDVTAFTAEVSPKPNPDIYVPAQSLDLYKNAREWKERKDKIFSIDDMADIRDLTDDDISYEVFSIQGIHITSTKNKDDIHNLPSGLYIINGKKIFLKN